MIKACSKGLGVSVTLEDLEFLKEEYKTARRDQHETQKANDNDLVLINYGIARGLEIALVKLGVSNEECDRLSQEAYQEAQQ